MKLNKKLISIFCLLPLLVGCEDYLNIDNDAEISTNIWHSEQSAQLFVNGIYSKSIPEFGGDYVYGTARPTSCSDEIGGNLNELMEGTLGFGKVGTFSADNYSVIRNINIALDEMKSSKMLPAARSNIEGQLYFLRAYQHWKMVLNHGGVPYVTTVVDYLTDEEIKNQKRDKTSDCIKYIQEDMQKAIDMLPAKWDDSKWGLATRATAASMLGRILLYYASPQFTPNQGTQVARDRWQAAYDANKKAIEICTQDGYGLLDCTTNVTEQWPVGTDINKVFLTRGYTNKEALFVTVYDAAKKYHGYENSVRPGSQTNNTTSRPSNMPSLLLVMAFPNADGSAYTKAANDLNYWQDRDPRFYSTIVYNGCYFPYKGNTSYRQWTYRNGDPSGNAATSTGYYTRKMLNPAIADFSKTSTCWIEMRYAEVLLNMAEAALEIGDDNTMYDCLGQLRSRAGIPVGDYQYGLKAPSSLSKIELLMNERMVELAFEGKRFYDLRRRNMFSNDLGENTSKINGQKKATWAVTYQLKLGVNATTFANNREGMTMAEVTSNMRASQATATDVAATIDYKCVTTEEELMNSTTGNYNFFDVPDGILTRSPGILQTMGWSYDAAVGCFNPFE